MERKKKDDFRVSIATSMKELADSQTKIAHCEGIANLREAIHALKADIRCDEDKILKIELQAHELQDFEKKKKKVCNHALTFHKARVEEIDRELGKLQRRLNRQLKKDKDTAIEASTITEGLVGSNIVSVACGDDSPCKSDGGDSPCKSD